MNEESVRGAERIREVLLYVVVLTVACLFRVASLDEGFWIDEVMSAATIRDGWTMMLTRIGFTDVHPPGYYTLLKSWAAMVGGGDLALRLLSLLASLGTIALLMRWIRAHADRLSALFGGLALSLAPFHIHYSVEVRAYALFTLVALALAWRLERWLSAPSARGLRTIVLLELAALSLHYYGLLWVGLLNLYVCLHLSRQEQPWRLYWLRAQLIALSVFSAWVPLLMVQLFELPEVMKAHLSDELPMTRVMAALGPLPSLTGEGVSVWVGLGILLLAAFGAWQIRGAALGEEDRDPTVPPSLTALGGVGICVALLVMPLLAMVVLPMSDALFEAYLRQLPGSYGVIVSISLIGGAAFQWVFASLRLPLPIWLLMGGPALVAVLTQVQPMLFLRNLLIFLPLVLLLASLALGRIPHVFRVLALLGVLGAGATHYGQGSDTFMPRQDFQAAAQALSPLQGVSVGVSPAWDADGLRRYAPDQVVTSVMGADELRSLASAPGPLVVLLARPSRHPLSAQEVTDALGASWRLAETRPLRGHRGSMQWLRYERHVE